MTISRILSLSLAAGMTFWLSLSSAAEFQNLDVSKLFDDRISYDIYFSSGDVSTNVVNSVEILRFEEVAGKTFLVIRSSGFNLKEEEGFILFDSISAILPDRNIKVEKTKGIRLR